MIKTRKPLLSFKHKLKAFSALALLVCPVATPAGVIQSPVDAVINSGGPGFGSILNTIDQSGLSTGFTSGVTDFDSYTASGPEHTVTFSGFEWFSNSGITSASVTYDMGAAVSIGGLALWNEDAAGIGALDLFASTDGINFSPLSLGLIPADTPSAELITSYPVEVFSFTSALARYIRFDMSSCPQPNPGSFVGCSIGEVAFDVGDGVPVPDPVTLLLLAGGLLGLRLGRIPASMQ